ncbi:tetratricopeptide repeat protein [Lutibacter sp.]|uniref:tetratricopeptide repeat-containing sensor histidine kinase n=1 Tax=Lutibacter sp. TaxID=1925666 RepID=UPI0025B9E509|nr:tetratricopeptide repeat protein [Lutibacter sp.]MCF6168948.1 tetratricopeptide repeat protein [Lutibacter sp.]
MKSLKLVLFIIFINLILIGSVFADNLNHPIEFSIDLKNKKLIFIKELIDQGKTKEALQQLYEVIDEVENQRDTIAIINGRRMLADILRDNGDFKKSNLNYSKIIPLIKSDYETLQYIYFKKGGNFQLDGIVDSALVNYKKAIEIGDKIKNKENLKAKIHANLSGVYYLKANYDKAIEHSKIAANYQKILGNSDIEAGIINNLGGIYYMQGKYKESLKMFQKTLSIVGDGKSELDKKTKRSAYINMAYAYSALDDYKKAYEYQDKYAVIDDSLKQELKYKEIAEIESKYKVAKKEKEAQIEKNKRLKAEYWTVGLSVASVILLLVIYIIFKLYKLSKKNYKLQMAQEQLIYKSTIEKVKSDAQSKILVATLDGRVEERKQIASVLHDNVSALLSAANLHLYASKKQLKGSVPIEIDKSQAIISDAADQIRDLSHKLMSSVLLKFGLATAVQDLCEKASNSTLRISANSKNIIRFNQNFEIKLFNIITEIVNNMIKHSEAQNGVIKLEQLNGNLQVIIFDDGKGFDVDNIHSEKGVGLSQIEARIHVLNGLINITSSNSGTRIFISVPIVY